MPIPDSTRPIVHGTYRATRKYLADHCFSAVPGGGEPPSDLLVQEQWEQLMTLPTDVLLRTTDYLGSMIDDMLTQVSVWTQAMPRDSAEAPLVFDAALDTHYELASAPFIAAHGWYRQATAALRNALELMTHAAAFAVRGDRPGYQAWRDGSGQAPRFGKSVDLIGRCPVVVLTESRVGQPGLFRKKPRGVLPSVYRNVCRYAHSEPGYANADIWGSNGPVFSGKAFTRFWLDFGDTLMACYVLMKISYPALALPRVVRSIAGNAGPSWHGLAALALEEYFAV